MNEEAGGGRVDGRNRVSAGPLRESAGAAFRGRLPELLIGATFVFLAVLPALVADEWRERRDREELAERALVGIVDEIRSNRDRLLADAERNRAPLAGLREYLRAREEGEEPEELSADYKVALTSSAAREAARMSQAVQSTDLEVVRELARLPEGGSP
ncbi:MAG: hypothetical protein R6X22_05475 [Gemmatimonadota bacterium]